MAPHAAEPPRPPRELNLTVPDGLEGVLDTMPAKDPAHRYPTPRQAAAALAAYVTSDEAAEAPSVKMQEYLKWLAARQPAEPVAARAAVRPTGPLAFPSAGANRPAGMRSLSPSRGRDCWACSWRRI